MRTTTQAKLDAARQALAAAETSVGMPAALPLEDGVQGLAVPEPLTELLPHGLHPGTVVQVQGSTSVLLALAQAAAGQERWCALVGMPDVGWAAAAETGLSLDRVVTVPRPGVGVAAVLGALVDGFDVLVAGPAAQVSDADQRTLLARVRQRGAVLLTDQVWAGAHLVVQVRASSWAGVADGHGVLTGRHMDIRAYARGRPARQVRVLAGIGGLRPDPELPSADVSGAGIAGADTAGAVAGSARRSGADNHVWAQAG